MNVNWKRNFSSKRSIQYNLFLTKNGIKIKKKIKRNSTVGKKTRISLKIHENKTIMKREQVEIEPTKRSDIVLKKSKATTNRNKNKTTNFEETMVSQMQRLSLKRHTDAKENSFKKRKM